MADRKTSTSMKKICKASSGMMRSSKPFRYNSQPTLAPCTSFNPHDDAISIRKAIMSLEIDMTAVINILTKRTDEQRLRIAMEYKMLFGYVSRKDKFKDLVSDIKIATTKQNMLQSLLVSLLTPLPQLYANELHYAVAGMRTHKGVLLEIVCTLSSHQIQVIKEIYVSKYGKRLEDDMRGDPSDYFNKSMIALCTANRSNSFHIHRKKAKEDATSLFRVAKLGYSLAESTFTSMFCSRSMPHLAVVFQEYQILNESDIEDTIKEKFSGDVRKALCAVVKVTRDKHLFFAERIYKSRKGLGANRTLNRILVTRCEIDLGDIMNRFQTEYGMSLQSWISAYYSGYYKLCLLSLLGINDLI